ncbi:MAG: hypothetical protein HYS27_08490 [Deltaproteobacteria bacterium]|nr:hypothetical protein [Deltaproteobacteria bacterium]
MIPGFNHNIKHKGRVYHIQTEDSGPKNPHVITHVFVGGNIIASKKTSYADIVDGPNWEKTVRSMMEEQHKQMLRNLVNGSYDGVETGTAYHLDGPAPMNFTATSPATSSMAGAAAFKGMPSATKGKVVTFTPAPGGVPVAAPPPSAPPQPAQPVQPDVVVGQALPASEGSWAEAAGDVKPPTPTTPPRPAPKGTIFGEDLISEKSLDEVILGYLSEDLGEG